VGALWRACDSAPPISTHNSKGLAALLTSVVVGFDIRSANPLVATLDRAEALAGGLARFVVDRITAIFARFDRHIFLIAMLYMSLYHSAISTVNAWILDGGEHCGDCVAMAAGSPYATEAA
jgi:hypothetical protein